VTRTFLSQGTDGQVLVQKFVKHKVGLVCFFSGKFEPENRSGLGPVSVRRVLGVTDRNKDPIAVRRVSYKDSSDLRILLVDFSDKNILHQRYSNVRGVLNPPDDRLVMPGQIKCDFCFR
jgi:hypothetical protein